MNITKENIDNLNATIRVQIIEEDYLPKLSEVLQDFRRKANLDGFRPGKAPMGLVKKMYGKAALVDEVNKLLSEKLSNFLFEGDFRILGEPLPNEDSPLVDWDTQKEFEFVFDVGLAPSIEVKLSKKDKVKWYTIEVDESMINDQSENHRKRFGGFEPTEISEKDDMVKGDLNELDEDGNKKDGGVEAIDALVSINTIQDEAIREQFVGLKVGDEITVDMPKTFPNETDLASLLKITKEQLPEISPTFKYTIGEVSRFAPVALDQELFDKIYGENEVKSEDEFRERIKTELQSHLERESYYKFHVDTKEKLVNKFKMDLPDEFLKRWMLATSKDEKLTPESLEEEYPKFSEDLQWQLIKDQIVRENELDVSEDEVKGEAINVARSQFQQYGLYDAPEEQLIQFAQSILTNEDEQRRIKERILEDKVVSFVKEAVKLDEQTLSLDDFKKLFE